MDNKCHYTIYSSFLFATNTLVALYTHQYLYSYLFFILTITSVTYHIEKNKIINKNEYIGILDKTFVALVIIYGSYIYYNKINKDILMCILVIITFLIAIFVHVYGYIIKDYSFHPDIIISEKYHSILHICSSIGHHIIITM